AIAAASGDLASAGAAACDRAAAGEPATTGAASRARCQFAVAGRASEAVTIVAAGGDALPGSLHAPARVSATSGSGRAFDCCGGSAATTSCEPFSAGEASAAVALGTAGAGSGRSGEIQVMRVDRDVPSCTSDRTGAGAAATWV